MSYARIASHVASALLVCALLIAAVLVVGPRTGAYRTLTILSGSMEPRFGAGDMVIATPAPTSSVRVGDVITYEAPIKDRPVVTHRVVRVDSSGRQPVVVTRGDANTADDPWRARLTSDTIWRQQAVIPGAGAVIRTLRHEALLKVATYGLPALLVLLVLFDVWKPAPTRRLELETEDAEWDWAWLNELELAPSFEAEHAPADWQRDLADDVRAAA